MKIFINIHIFQLIDQKLNSKGLFQPLVVTHLFQIQFLSTHGNVMFVQNSISYKTVPKNTLEYTYFARGGNNDKKSGSAPRLFCVAERFWAAETFWVAESFWVAETFWVAEKF